MIQLTLPRLSLAMEEAKILSWLAADGDAVRAGQPVAEIETDKATLEIESPADGVLHIMAPAGTIVSVEQSLAEIATLTEEETEATQLTEKEGHDAAGEAAAEVDTDQEGAGHLACRQAPRPRARHRRGEPGRVRTGRADPRCRRRKGRSQ